MDNGGDFIMDRYAIYLRKSRADLEAEARGEGETLAKHKRVLFRYAKDNKLNIVKLYEEVVSGESVIHRPKMIQLLNDVDDDMYDGVLCMDMDRLGRGDMQDQGLILNTFKNSNTKIITPRKTYDLNNEIDEEYSEFETFIARRELKIITRRLQGGRLETVQEGWYIGSYPPLGYSIKYLDKGKRTLEENEKQSPIVRLIFELYTSDDPSKRLGSARIANKLNELGYEKYTGGPFNSWDVLNIIKNAVYAGRIQWKRKEIKKSTEPGKKKDTRTRPRSEWIDVKGKHEPLISMEVYQKAQDILANRSHPPFHLSGIKNPLAGILKCGNCGSTMVLRPYTTQKPHLMCAKQKQCHLKSTQFDLVEQRLLDSLNEYLESYKNQWLETKPTKKSEHTLEMWHNTLNGLKKENDMIQTQQTKLFDLLERGIYTEEIFIERSNNLAERIETNTNAIKKAQAELIDEEKRQQARNDIIPTVERVLDLYPKTDDPAQKNMLLKSVLEKAVYFKSKGQFKDDFKLVIYPNIKRSKGFQAQI
jgi:DNA invertase Pin-like site-specific DNA recombinase